MLEVFNPILIGQRKIALNGFLYQKKEETGGSAMTAWQCTLPGCPGELFTDSNCVTVEFSKQGLEHTHPPSQSKVAEERTLHKIQDHLQHDLAKPINEAMLAQLVEEKMTEEEESLDKDILLKKATWWQRVASIKVRPEKVVKAIQEPYEGTYAGDIGNNVLEVFSSTKGRPKIILNGFIYVRKNNHKTAGTIPWRCEVRNCRGKARSDSACLQAEAFGYHSHPPDHVRVEVSKIKANMMKRMAEEGNQEGRSKSDLAKEIMAEVPEELVEHMPKMVSIRNYVCSARKHHVKK